MVFSDSFLVVTEPDFTSFHQLAKLLTNIDLMAQQENTQPYIRGVIVNKAIDGEEERFRALLESQFGIEFGLSWPIPLDQDAIQFYKNQLIPYLSSPRSKFSYSTLKAFTEIFDIVTVEWTRESKNKWHNLFKNIETAKIEEQTKAEAEEKKIRTLQEQAIEEIKKAKYVEKGFQLKVESLENQLKDKKEQHEKTESEMKKLRNELKKAELGSVKKSSVQRMLLVIFGGLILVLAILYYFSNRTNIIMQNELSKTKEEVEYQKSKSSYDSKPKNGVMINMTIGTIPSGASVFIDGKKMGTTPFNKNVNLYIGAHQLRIEMKGYSTYSEEFIANPSQKATRRDINLQRGIKLQQKER